MSILWIASNLPLHPKIQAINFQRKSVKDKPDNKAKCLLCLLCFHFGLVHLHSSLLGEVTFSSVKSCWLELAACMVREVLLLSLFVSPENKSDWLLLVLGVESSSGCFFWKSFSLCGFLFSAKHLEQRFIVLLDLGQKIKKIELKNSLYF